MSSLAKTCSTSKNESLPESGCLNKTFLTVLQRLMHFVAKNGDFYSMHTVKRIVYTYKLVFE